MSSQWTTALIFLISIWLSLKGYECKDLEELTQSFSRKIRSFVESLLWKLVQGSEYSIGLFTQTQINGRDLMNISQNASIKNILSTWRQAAKSVILWAGFLSVVENVYALAKRSLIQTLKLCSLTSHKCSTLSTLIRLSFKEISTQWLLCSWIKIQTSW